MLTISGQGEWFDDRAFLMAETYSWIISSMPRSVLVWLPLKPRPSEPTLLVLLTLKNDHVDDELFTFANTTLLSSWDKVRNKAPSLTDSIELPFPFIWITSSLSSLSVWDCTMWAPIRWKESSYTAAQFSIAVCFHDDSSGFSVGSDID